MPLPVLLNYMSKTEFCYILQENPEPFFQLAKELWPGVYKVCYHIFRFDCAMRGESGELESENWGISHMKK